MRNILNQLGLKERNNLGFSINGKWLKNNNGLQIESINPYTSEVISTVQLSSDKQCEMAVEVAHDAFLKWRLIPAPKRGDIVRQIGNLLREKKELLAKLISIETGKIFSESLGEVQEMIDMADFAVGQSRMLYGLTIASERVQHTLLEKWHPLGVVGIITAFNFPMAVWAWNAFLAIVTGNTVVWKPSSKTPLCAIALQEICNNIMKKNKTPSIFSLTIFHDKSISDRFLDNQKIALIAFTGSTHTGKYIAERVSKRLGKTLLEMGGNNAIIVDESANKALALRAILFGAVGTSGQRCTTARRLFLHENIYDEMLKKLINAYKKINIGDPLNKKTLMGPLISREAVNSHYVALESVTQLGGKIVYGNKPHKKNGNFVFPSIVTAENHWDIVQTETFSPILYVMKYQKLDDAVLMQNNSRYGLSSSLFTTNLQQAEYFISAMGSDCGIANINVGTSGAEIGGAFGGEKNTGGGRESGSDAWKSYMRRQTNTVNWSNELPLAQGVEFG